MEFLLRILAMILGVNSHAYEWKSSLSFYSRDVIHRGIGNRVLARL